jgi:predicted RNA-binding protein with RPS1 domain
LELYENWLVVMEKSEGNLTRDEIIDGYIKTLAQVIGSEEEVRMKIYYVSTRNKKRFSL